MKAFSNLLSSFNGDQIFIHHPDYGNQLKTYHFYDMVHIIKNIRNNLVNSKKFIFPAFNFDQLRDKIFVPSGYVQWSLFHRLHEEETKLDARLRKAHKINPNVLHPGQNKQDVSRALAIFHETTSAVIKSYFPHRQDAAQFLNLIHKVFLVWNSKTRAHGSNSLGDAAKTGDNKVCFLRASPIGLKSGTCVPISHYASKQAKPLLWLWEHGPVSLNIFRRKDTIIIFWLLNFRAILWNAGSAVIVKWMVATFW